MTKKIGSENTVDVYVQDQFTRAFSLRLNKYLQTDLTLSEDAVLNSRVINLTAGHGLTGGEYIVLLQEPQFFFAKVISVSVNELTLDTLIPYAFSAADTSVVEYDPELNKNGSSTTYIAELRNPFSFAVNIKRLLFHITDETAMDDALFGGLPALTNGISLRKEVSDGYWHYWNIKNNGDIGELAYDKKYDDKAPSGVYGITARLTYAGQDKHGSAIRLEQNEALQLLIQDDLTGLLTFTLTVEGRFANE